MSSGEDPLWDIAIIGGGPAGAVAAIELTRKGNRVVLIEQRQKQTVKLGESLPPQVRPLAEKYLAAANRNPKGPADSGCYCSYGNTACWGNDKPHQQDFIYTPNGYGLHLDRPRFDAALRQSAKMAGTDVWLGYRVWQIQPHRPFTNDARWLLTLQNEQCQQYTIKTQFIIDCSGRTALFSRLCGVKRNRQDRLFAFARCYQQAENATPDQDTLTRIEASAEGWWYSVRLPTLTDHVARRIAVFHTDRDLPAAKQAVSEQGFDALLAQTQLIDPYLHDYSYEATPWTAGKAVRGAAANSERLEVFSGPGWLAAGDAAQAFDPLSSQGIGNAISSGISAAQTAHQYLHGDEGVLSRYSVGLERIYALYRRQYFHFYTAEQRWPTQKFWARRHAAAETPLTSFTLDPVMPAHSPGKESSCAH